MLILVTGGASSGKSSLAERLAAALGTPRVYIATLRPSDGESDKRIARHRALRAGKGFETLECPVSLEAAARRIPPGAVALLECVTTLTANEMYDPDGAGEGAFQAVVRGVDALCGVASAVVAVTGDVFCDGVEYGSGTQQYIETLGSINQALCARADHMAEVVCGIPLYHKGFAQDPLRRAAELCDAELQPAPDGAAPVRRCIGAAWEIGSAADPTPAGQDGRWGIL